MKLQISQMSLATAIMGEIDQQAKKQGIKNLGLEPFQLNAIFEGATKMIEEIGRERVDSKAAMGLTAWLMSDDTGMSSKAMAHHLCGAPLRNGDYGDSGKNHPLDPSDFGRCYRFLQAVPEARARLPKMSGVSEVWSRLVGAWDELTKVYLEELPSGKCRKLYDRMKELGC